jgi:hypothetical protein
VTLNISSANQNLNYSYGQNNTSAREKQDISSVEENKALVKSAIEELFNQRNVSAADKYIAEDLINNNPLAGQGREPLKQYFEKLYFTVFLTLKQL